MTKKVLIAEDEPALSHSLNLKLQAAGMQTLVVKDGQAALDALRAEHFDVVLLDIIMPVLDGFHVLEALSKKPPMPKVIVLSNLAQPEDQKRVLALGAQKYMVKSDVPLTQIVDEIGRA